MYISSRTAPSNMTRVHRVHYTCRYIIKAFLVFSDVHIVPLPLCKLKRNMTYNFITQAVCYVCLFCTLILLDTIHLFLSRVGYASRLNCWFETFLFVCLKIEIQAVVQVGGRALGGIQPSPSHFGRS